MKNSYFTLRFVILFSLSITIKGYAQNTINYINYQDVYKYSDSIYGDNDIIENGVIYKTPNSKINGSPFLNDTVWNKSVLYLSGKKFVKYPTKYDLLNDELIIKVLLNKTKTINIVLNKLFIDSFILGNKKFINTNKFDSCTIKINYIQELYKGKLSFYKDFNKIFIGIYNDQNPSGKFSDLKSDIYVYDDKRFNRVNKKKELINIFKSKSNKKKIKTFLKQYINNLKKLPPEDLISIMNYCNTVYEKN